jgi:hypothetical protein
MSIQDFLYYNFFGFIFVNFNFFIFEYFRVVLDHDHIFIMKDIADNYIDTISLNRKDHPLFDLLNV